jgi:hypothetical protein
MKAEIIAFPHKAAADDPRTIKRGVMLYLLASLPPSDSHSCEE